MKYVRNFRKKLYLLEKQKELNQCVIVNRNYPPRAGMTGSSANELAGYLESRGVSVSIVTQKANYSGGGIENTKVHGTIFLLRSYYNGKNKLIRLLSSLVEGWFLYRKAISLNISTIICMTDPPLLNLWFSISLRRNSFFWIYWSMDLYPDAFASNGLVSRKNIFYRLIYKSLRRNIPNGLIALGSNQSKFISEKIGAIPQQVIFPAGIQNFEQNESPPFWAENDQKIVIGYIGNIGEAHNPKFILSAINSIDPDRHILILSIYGSKADKVLEYASDRAGVIVCSHIMPKDLGFIDLQMVSLLPEWDNVCVPSKAFTAISAGSALILNCSVENDIWSLLKEASWHLPVGLESQENFKKILNIITPDTINEKKQMAKKIFKQLNEYKNNSFEEIYSMIAS